MRKILLTLLLIIYFTNCKSQILSPKVLDLPENPSTNDFSFLKEELKGVQIIMLGENTHFDGNVFEMKTKIIKYLYQEMGFKTIAFESGIYDVWKAKTEIEKGVKVAEALKNSLFPIWSSTKEFESFFQFYETNKTDLKLFGFDNQITGKYGDEKLFSDLFEYCNDNKIKVKLDLGDLELLFESMSKSYIFDENDISYNEFKSGLNGILKSISKIPASEASFYWTQTIKSLLVIGEMYYSKHTILSPFWVTKEDNRRDKQMADNLLAYIKLHPNEKIICWGANSHFTNDMSSITEPILKEFVPMGSYIKKELKEKAYSLASISAADSINLNKKWEKTPVNTKSFEYWLKSKNKPHLFVSSRQNEMKIKQLNRFFSPEIFVEANLDQIFDGYLFFSNVTPSTFVANQFNDDTINEKNISENNTNNNTQETTNTIITNLREVVVYGKKHPYSIVKKAIENNSKNYPSNELNSTLATNIDVKMANTTVLNMDFIANQYDKGYIERNRSYYQLQEIRYNVKNGYDPKALRSEFFYFFGLNRIKMGRYFNNRKFKKFIYTQNEDEVLDGKEVYSIDFSTIRDHFNYTERQYFSNYSGTLYINKEDYAVVKVIENWEVVKYPENTVQEMELYGWPKKYTKREDVNETRETYFTKINNVYYLSYTHHILNGNLFDQENNKSQFTTVVKSYWNNFNTENPTLIKYKEEITVFDKVKFNESFWETFKFPKINN